MIVIVSSTVLTASQSYWYQQLGKHRARIHRPQYPRSHRVASGLERVNCEDLPVKQTCCGLADNRIWIIPQNERPLSSSRRVECSDVLEGSLELNMISARMM